MATHVERYIEVEVPVRTAYDQWTQFEDFPRFMSGVEQVRQIGGALTHWVAEIAGVRREWDAAILEQVPDQKIAWAATTGATNAGAVYFEAVSVSRTRVRLTLDYEPEGLVERVGDLLDLMERRAVADLDRFKQFIESRRAATGGWRGAIDEGEVQAGSETPHDPDAGFLTGFPGERISHTDTGAQGADDPAAGVLTGFPGDRTASHLGTGAESAHDPDAGFLTGFPGERISHTDTGAQGTDDPAAGILTGFRGQRTPSHLGAASTADQREEPATDQPGTRTDTTN